MPNKNKQIVDFLEIDNDSIKKILSEEEEVKSSLKKYKEINKKTANVAARSSTLLDAIEYSDSIKLYSLIKDIFKKSDESEFKDIILSEGRFFVNNEHTYTPAVIARVFDKLQINNKDEEEKIKIILAANKIVSPQPVAINDGNSFSKLESVANSKLKKIFSILITNGLHEKLLYITDVILNSYKEDKYNLKTRERDDDIKSLLMFCLPMLSAISERVGDIYPGTRVEDSEIGSKTFDAISVKITEKITEALINEKFLKDKFDDRLHKLIVFKPSERQWLHNAIESDSLQLIAKTTLSAVSMRVFISNNLFTRNLEHWPVSFTKKVLSWQDTLPKELSDIIDKESLKLNTVGVPFEINNYYNNLKINELVASKVYSPSRSAEIMTKNSDNKDLFNLFARDGKKHNLFNDFSCFATTQSKTLLDTSLFKNHSLLNLTAKSDDGIDLIFDHWSRIEIAPVRFLTTLGSDGMLSFIVKNKEKFATWRDCNGNNILHFAFAILSSRQSTRMIMRHLVDEFPDLLVAPSKINQSPLDLVADDSTKARLTKKLINTEINIKNVVKESKKQTKNTRMF